MNQLKIALALFLLTPLMLLADTWELVYLKKDQSIYQAYKVNTGPSIVPVKTSRRLTMSVIRVEETPNWDEINLHDYRVVPSILASATIIVEGKRTTATSTIFYQNPDGNQIEFNSVKYQSGLITPQE